MTQTVWDKIYIEFSKGGPAYATLAKGIVPGFKSFVETATFPSKIAFDVGYGTGKYLQYLKLHSFQVEGLDSSNTAYKMASKTLGSGEGLMVGDMYEYEFSQNRYSFIFSIHALHHGTKNKINKLIEKIYEGLCKEGWIYITLPLYSEANHWHNFKEKEEIEPGTFLPLIGPEKGLPHSFFSKEEVSKLFNKFDNLKIEEIEGIWHIIGKKSS